MSYETILTEQHDDILVITLNRPDRMNAWTPHMSIELTQAIEAADADRSVGALVVTGAGRGFCAGADISAVFDSQLKGGDQADVTQQRDWIDLIRSTKPIVAAVNGPVIGVGLTLILPFDRIMVARGAKFSMGFIKMGLVPELASSMFLPMRCGIGVASDLMLSGRTVTAEEAVDLRLAEEVVEPEDLLEAAIGRARSYAENPTPQLRWIKQLLTQNVNETDTIAAQRREFKQLLEAYKTPEHKEAVSAFMEKRKPVFR